MRSEPLVKTTGTWQLYQPHRLPEERSQDVGHKNRPNQRRDLGLPSLYLKAPFTNSRKRIKPARAYKHVQVHAGEDAPLFQNPYRNQGAASCYQSPPDARQIQDHPHRQISLYHQR